MGPRIGIFYSYAYLGFWKTLHYLPENAYLRSCHPGHEIELYSQCRDPSYSLLSPKVTIILILWQSRSCSSLGRMHLL